MSVRWMVQMGAALWVAALATLVFALSALAQPENDAPGLLMPNACEYALNDRCDAPAPEGTGMCPLGGDFADCEGRDAPTILRSTFFGYDDRVLFDSAEWPWRTIGQYNRDNRGSCSGVLIAEDVVLTAAHCVIVSDAIQSAGEFITARGRPQGPARARVVEAHVLETLRADPGAEGYYRENRDWALLKLDRPVGAEVGFLPVEAVADNRPMRRDLISFIAIAIITLIASFALQGIERRALQIIAGGALIVLSGFAVSTLFGEDPRLEQVWQAGYSGDTGTNLSGNENCRILDFQASGLISHNCDTVPGDSGSPLLVRRGDDWAIIALVSHSRSSTYFYGTDPSQPNADRAYAVSSSVVPDPDAVFGPGR